jgi:hypothetical protein
MLAKNNVALDNFEFASHLLDQQKMDPDAIGLLAL